MKIRQNKQSNMKVFDEKHKKYQEVVYINFRFLAYIAFFIGGLLMLIPYAYVKRYIILFPIISFVFLLGIQAYLYPYLYFKNENGQKTIYEILSTYPVEIIDIFLSRLKYLAQCSTSLIIMAILMQGVNAFKMKKLTADLILYPLSIQAGVFLLSILSLLPWESFLKKR